MKIEHPSFSVPGKAVPITQDTVPIQSYEVHDAEDEARFTASMTAAMSSFEGQPERQPTEDPIVKQEIAKKGVLEKLKFFKQAHYKEATLGGLDFKMKLLKSPDKTFVLDMMRKHAENETYKYPIMVLAASIETVNGIPLENYYSGPDIDNSIIKKYYEVSEWNTAIQNALVEVYQQLETEVEAGYTKDFLVK